MRDLQSHRWMWIKAVLFLLIGMLALALILIELPEWHILALVALAIWSFCRAYYFAFYVLERYVDPSYRFSGLFSLIRHLWSRKKHR